MRRILIAMLIVLFGVCISSVAPAATQGGTPPTTVPPITPTTAWQTVPPTVDPPTITPSTVRPSASNRPSTVEVKGLHEVIVLMRWVVVAAFLACAILIWILMRLYRPSR